MFVNNNMKCQDVGCPKTATKNLKTTYPHGKGNIINLCNSHTVEYRDIYKAKGDSDEYDHTVVVKDLS